VKIVGHGGHIGYNRGGAVNMLLAVLKELDRRGHQVRLVTPGGLSAQHLKKRGIEFPISVNPLPMAIRRIYAQADVVLTQSTGTPRAVHTAMKTDVPLVHIVHDDGQLGYFKVKPEQTALVVFNSFWLQEVTNWPGPSIVLHPPIFAKDCQVPRTGKSIVQVSLSEQKGGRTFWNLAQALPERSFVGVQGPWGRQLQPDPPPENVTLLGYQQDVRKVYEQARIVLCPAQDLQKGRPYWTEHWDDRTGLYWTESWGIVAVEAIMSGIPVIAHPTPGLVESLGKAGLFADRENVQEWVDVVQSLDDPEVYEHQSALALERAAELEPTTQFDFFEDALRRIAGAPDEEALEMPTRVKARRSFLSGQGMRRSGDEFELPELRVQQLLARGLVVRLDPAPEIGPSSIPQQPQPGEVKGGDQVPTGVTITFRCEACGRSFKTKSGLASHTRANHPELIKKEPGLAVGG